jgi:predicted DNA-binding transcriptional regulator AlpA
VSNDRTTAADEPSQRDQLLHPKAVAKWLGVPVSTLYSWKYRGLGPAALRIGKHLRYEREAILEWIAQQRDRARAS